MEGHTLPSKGQSRLFLLRVEAVNLDAFVLDSDDLSTIRGAGLLVLGTHQICIGGPDCGFDGHESLLTQSEDQGEFCFSNETDEEMHESLHLKLISEGASICLYEFKASHKVALKTEDRFRDWLRRHQALRHATYEVAVAEMDPHSQKSYQNASEQTLMSVRRQQLKDASVTLGSINTQTRRGAGFCDIDRKRPATVTPVSEGRFDTTSALARAQDKNFVSEATDRRRAYGRNMKVRLYHMLGGGGNAATVRKTSGEDSKNINTSWTFQDIAARGERRADGDDIAPDPFGKIKDKIAVVYIDGNKFSRQIRELTTTSDDQAAIDCRIQKYRRELMRSLINRMQATNSAHWRVKTPDGPHEEALRFETLMWGGDEMTWVVPAWCGLEVVQFFFDQTQAWHLDESDPSKLLTHSMGVVFCSHNAPVRSAVQLAKRLADSVKDDLAKQQKSKPKEALSESGEIPYFNQSSSNAVAYQVLESFDSIGCNFDEARRTHRFKGMSNSQSILSQHGFSRLVHHMNQLKVDVRLPRTRLYQLSKIFSDGEKLTDETGLPEGFDLAVERISKTLGSLEATKIASLLKDPLHWQSSDGLSAKWFHLVELWEYSGCLSQARPNLNTQTDRAE